MLRGQQHILQFGSTLTLLIRCGPCHAIAPIFEKLSGQYPNVNFLKCDVDAAPTVSAAYSIKAMSCISSSLHNLVNLILLIGLPLSFSKAAPRSTKSKAQTKGQDQFPLPCPTLSLYSELENTIKKHATSSSTPAFSGKGHTLGGDPAAPDLVGEVKGTLDGLLARFNELNPQAKVLLGLLGLYFVFWFF
jgi:thioredoxin 1